MGDDRVSHVAECDGLHQAVSGQTLTVNGTHGKSPGQCAASDAQAAFYWAGRKQ